MTEPDLRVVYDCNVFAQAMINTHGPAARCIEQVLAGKLRLFWSDYVLGEIRRIPEKSTPGRLGITPEIVERLLAPLQPVAILAGEPPSIYQHPFDPKDSHYVNLALATGSTTIVSSDKHLLNLVNPARRESVEFRQRFPSLDVLTPWDLLQRLETGGAERDAS
jgi:putative PIN family toxin of toxin-antitoxin system